MTVLRTPDHRFADLPDFDYAPRHVDVDWRGDAPLRVAYLDEGRPDAPVVVLLHGEPSWSFLYRKMVPVIVEAGYRVIAPDLVGFGRSDKPSSLSDHTYLRHVEAMRTVVLDHLDLANITLFCQDWGGLIGLRLVAEHPDRFARVCAANTGLPDGTRRLPDAWWAFHDFVERTPDLPIGTLVGGAVSTPLTPEVRAAYDAPFPDASFKAGPRAFPDLIPQTLDDPATPDNQRAWRSLEQWTKPFLCLFSDADPITAGGERALIHRIPGARGQPHATVPGGHFLQEDSGAEIARQLVRWADRDRRHGQ
jgi:haloalkane dehalogenase